MIGNNKQPGRSRRLRLEALESRAVPALFTVTNTDDIGLGSLRQAILDANAAPGADSIGFAIPGSEVQRISPTSSLPIVADSLTIDGFSQPGSSLNTNGPDQLPNAVFMIQVDGSRLTGYGSRMLRFTSGSNIVRGLSMVGFSGNDLEFTTAGGNIVEGNNLSGALVVSSGSGNRIGGANPAARNVISRISISSDNNLLVGNISASEVITTSAVNILGSHNQIGGLTPAERNVISGGRQGLYLGGSFNIVQGNFIGTDVSGMHNATNRIAGVLIEYNSTGNLIGGTQTGAGNVISGSERGIYVRGGTSNTIQGNLIGTNATSTVALGNQYYGIELSEYAGSGSNNLVGGTIAGAGNVIAGGNVGILINAAFNTVQGNLIGTLADGITAAGSAVAAVDLLSSSSHDNLIGGATPRAGNVIAYSTGVAGSTSANGVGVLVASYPGYDPPVRNAILGNSIFGNAALGIDLTNDPSAPGVTLNDAGDSDGGANYLQNFPVLKSAVTGGSTTIHGSLNSTPSTTFRIEFFSSPSADPSGYGEGGNFVGAINLTTDAGGNASFTATLSTALKPGNVITATATDSANNTSEFSRAVTVVAELPDEWVSPLPPVSQATSSPLQSRATMIDVAVNAIDPNMAMATAITTAADDHGVQVSPRRISEDSEQPIPSEFPA
jgi:parallel beta-helix repeat protein